MNNTCNILLRFFGKLYIVSSYFPPFVTSYFFIFDDNVYYAIDVPYTSNYNDLFENFFNNNINKHFENFEENLYNYIFFKNKQQTNPINLNEFKASSYITMHGYKKKLTNRNLYIIYKKILMKVISKML